jgi:hypothetical protein
MIVAAVFSLPLLVLHVSAVLGLRFAVTRVLPLAVFSLGLVVNGVYGGELRDYLFMAAIVLVIAYVTVTFPAWAARRERHRQESDAAYAAERKALVETITTDLGKRVADLKAAGAQAERQLNLLADVEETAPARARLKAARESVRGLTREHEELLNRLSSLPVYRDWQLSHLLPDLKKDAHALGERVNLCLLRLRAELTDILASDATGEPVRAGQTHCAACGRTVPRAPFCQQCGAVQAVAIVCPQCGEKNLLPAHLFPPGGPLSRELFCTGCGTVLTGMVRLPQPAGDRAEKPSPPGAG